MITGLILAVPIGIGWGILGAIGDSPRWAPVVASFLTCVAISTICQQAGLP